MGVLARAPVRGHGFSPLDPVDGGPTLDELLVDAWEVLTSDRVARCPACGAEMEPEYGADAIPVGGRCRSCRARLT